MHFASSGAGRGEGFSQCHPSHGGRSIREGSVADTTGHYLYPLSSVEWWMVVALRIAQELLGTASPNMKSFSQRNLESRDLSPRR